MTTPSLDVLADDLFAAAAPHFAGTTAGSLGVALRATRGDAALIMADGAARLLEGAQEIVDTAGMLASLWLNEALPAAARRNLGRAVGKGTAVTHVFVYRYGALVLAVESDGGLRQIARRVVDSASASALQ